MKKLGTILLILVCIYTHAQENNSVRNIAVVPSFGYCFSLSTNLSMGDHTSKLIRPFMLHFVQAGIGLEYLNKRSKYRIGLNSTEMNSAYKVYFPSTFTDSFPNYEGGEIHYRQTGIRELSLSYSSQMGKIKTFRAYPSLPVSFSFFYTLGISHFHESPLYSDTLYVYFKSTEQYQGEYKEIEITDTRLTFNSWGGRMEGGVQTYIRGKEGLRIAFRLDISTKAMRQSVVKYNLGRYAQESLSTGLYPSYFGFILSYPIRVLNFR